MAGLDSCRKHEGSASEVTANIESGVASVHQQNAQAQDPIIADLKAQHEKDAANLGRLNAERDALLKRLASIPKPHVDPAVPGAVGSDGVGPSGNPGELDLLRATVEKDAEVIEAQEILIKNQSEQILVITKKAEEWEAAAKARERQALAQEAATKAWKDAVTTSRTRGRIEGFAAGFALGYVGGRR